MRKTITLFFLLSTTALMGQVTPLISQYMFNGLPLNPAISGSRDALTIVGTVRSQWAGLEGAPRTQSLSIHSPMKADKLAFGLVVHNDAIGVSQRTGALVNAAYRLRMRTGVLSVGLAGGMTQARSNWEAVETDQPGDESFSGGAVRQFTPEASAGLYYYTNQYYVSVSSPMFLSRMDSPASDIKPGRGRGRTGQVKPGLPVMINAGLRIGLVPGFTMSPSMMLRKSGANTSLDVNVLMQFHPRVEAGFSYRSAETIVFMGRFGLTDQLRVGYAYDMGSGVVAQVASGSHEVTLSYDFRYKTLTQNPRFF